MKVIWNGMDLVILIIGGGILVICGLAYIVLCVCAKIKEWRGKSRERTDKA